MKYNITETEKNNFVWPENSPYKSYKRGKLPLFCHSCLFVDIQVHMASGHDISIGQRNLSKNKNLTAISKKG